MRGGLEREGRRRVRTGSWVGRSVVGNALGGRGGGGGGKEVIRTLNWQRGGDGRTRLGIDWNWRYCSRNGDALGQRNRFATRSIWDDGFAIFDVPGFTSATSC